MKRIAYLAFMVLPIVCLGQTQDAGTEVPSVAGTSDSSRPALAPPPKTPEGVLEHVHGRLKLTDAQQPLWSDYVSRIDNYNKVFYQEKPVSSLTGDSAPRQIARFIDNMQNRLAALDEIERSTKALYLLLDADQKLIADQSLLSTVPVFAPSLNANSSFPNEARSRKEKPDGSHQKRRGGSMSGMGQ